MGGILDAVVISYNYSGYITPLIGKEGSLQRKLLKAQYKCKEGITNEEAISKCTQTSWT